MTNKKSERYIILLTNIGIIYFQNCEYTKSLDYLSKVSNSFDELNSD